MSLKVLRTLAFSELTSKNTLYLANAFVNCGKKKKKSGPYKSLILPEFTLYGTYVKPPAPEKLKEYRNGLFRLSITHIQWSTSISFIVPIYLAYKVGVYKILLP